MHYRQLGCSGLIVSAVGLGCNNFGGKPLTSPAGTVYGALDLDRSRAVIHAALDAGITLFDTADVYGEGGSERFLGEVLRERRHEVVIATKWGSGLNGQGAVAWGSRSYIRRAVVASLGRLRTDYIDLYQLHWPDPRTPLEETLQTLDDLVREGKIRYSGSSHFSGWQVADSDWLARTQRCDRGRFVAAQNHYSLLERSAALELIPSCRRFGVGLLPYFPLENGLLTGKYRRGEALAQGRIAGRTLAPQTYDCIEALAQYACRRGRAMVDVAVGGLLADSVVSSVITGATSAEQIAANAAAAQWRPAREDLEELDGLLQAHAVAGVSGPVRTSGMEELKD